MQGEELNQVHYPMRRYVWRHFLVALFSIFIGAAVGAKAVSGPTVILQKMDHSTVSYRGGEITVEATVEHKRKCPVIVRRWLGAIDPDHPDAMPTDWRWVGESYAPPIPIGKPVTFKVHFSTPLNTPQGAYQAAATADDDCSWNPFRSPTRFYMFKVDIKDPTDASPAPVLIPTGAATIIKTPAK